ncbi:non-canonical purine NTP pyrophosphatase, partial [Candidatus Bathyarchaeota archaeon]|nr:non-canonical purine NTP pyrophosphatase [Candidatus Bathyarchaeota archaeon]
RGGGKTYAEMTIEDKNQYSHRSKAFKKFVKWYCQNYKCKS